MPTSSYQLVPITEVQAELLRERDATVYISDKHPGYPCRQCLQDADIGDELILVSHDPFHSASPYRSSSPIFIHRRSCQPYVETSDGLPLQLTGRQLSVRLFDCNEMMIDATLIDGTELGATLNRFFQTDGADQVHVHNAVRGCWAVTVQLATPSH